jgi:hypothetical protein
MESKTAVVSVCFADVFYFVLNVRPLLILFLLLLKMRRVLLKWEILPEASHNPQ